MGSDEKINKVRIKLGESEVEVVSTHEPIDKLKKTAEEIAKNIKPSEIREADYIG
jgi:rRNA processing protein Krr1/Pno1